VQTWSIWGVVADGECAYSAYWVGSEPEAYGPDICMEDGPEVYVSSWGPIYFTEAFEACSTILTISGMPCLHVYVKT